MFTRFSAPRSPRFWIPLLVAASAATFVAGITAGASLPRATADGGTVADRDGAGVAVTTSLRPVADAVARAAGSRSLTDPSYSVDLGKRVAQAGAHTPIDPLSGAEWQALYGAAAASWGVWKGPPRNLSSAEWQALYGPTAAAWGIWRVDRAAAR